MLVKDSRGRQAALIESSDTPCVEIRGSRGKMRIDEWLMYDNANPYVALIWFEKSYFLNFTFHPGICGSCFGMKFAITGPSRTIKHM